MMCVDRVIVLDKGQIVAEGEPKDILSLQKRSVPKERAALRRFQWWKEVVKSNDIQWTNNHLAFRSRKSWFG